MYRYIYMKLYICIDIYKYVYMYKHLLPQPQVCSNCSLLLWRGPAAAEVAGWRPGFEQHVDSLPAVLCSISVPCCPVRHLAALCSIGQPCSSWPADLSQQHCSIVHPVRPWQWCGTGTLASWSRLEQVCKRLACSPASRL